METHRKHVVVYGAPRALVGALRFLLSDLEVLDVATLDRVPPEADLVIYQADGKLDATRLARAAVEKPTLVLGESSQLIDAIEASCRGFLPDSASLEEVGSAVRTILDGGSVVPPDLLGRVLRHLVDRQRRIESNLDLDVLTEREREVFHLAIAGARKEEIADRLFISPGTARTHLQRLYKKLGVHSQAELIALALQGQETAKGDS